MEIQNNGNILSVPAVPLPYNTGIGKILFDSMVKNKYSIAQIYAPTGEIETYGSMLQKSIRAAIVMRSKGIASKDVISMCSGNHQDTYIPIISSMFLGVHPASTDPELTLTDTIYLLEKVRPKMIFVSPDAVKLIEDTLQEIGLVSEIVVFGETSKHTKFSEFLVESPEESRFVPIDVVDLKETVTMFFSSGTSGMPKAICVSHLAILSQIPSKAEAAALDGWITLSYSKPYWISSFLSIIMATTTRQCRIVCPHFDAHQLWTLIEKYKISLLFLSPAQIAQALHAKRPDGIDLSSMKFFLTGGAAVHLEQLERIKKAFPKALLMSGYGQTELGGGVFTFKLSSGSKDLRLLLKKPTSCGKPKEGYAYKVVDPDTAEILGPNQQGELRIKTEYQMNGYYNQDSSSAWDEEGFLKTGDIVYYDEDYCFYIVDRIKEILKFQSWQIAPAKLEAILMTHPAIDTAVVIGLPHPADGDHPLALVVLKKSDPAATPTEIEKYVEEKVDDKQRLRGGVKIVEKLHVTPTGKFKRRFMRDLVLQGKI